MNRYDDYSTAKHFQRMGEQPRKVSVRNYKDKEWIKESEHTHEGAPHSDYNRKANKNYLRAALPILQSKLHH